MYGVCKHDAHMYFHDGERGFVQSFYLSLHHSVYQMLYRLSLDHVLHELFGHMYVNYEVMSPLLVETAESSIASIVRHTENWFLGLRRLQGLRLGAVWSLRTYWPATAEFSSECSFAALLLRHVLAAMKTACWLPSLVLVVY